MKKEVSPAVIGIVLAIVLLVAGAFLYKSASGKQGYPGENVGAGGGPPMTQADGEKMRAMMGKKK